MSKHTPGPWDRIIADGYTVRHPQIYSDTGPVANATFLGEGRVDELNANARLIAAAPDLLAALQNVLRWMPVYPKAADAIVGGRASHQKAIDAAKAAIAKAGGES